jgi:hypothetical protein
MLEYKMLLIKLSQFYAKKSTRISTTSKLEVRRSIYKRSKISKPGIEPRRGRFKICKH